jgi:ribonuclease R
MLTEDILNHVRCADYRPGKIRELARQMGIAKPDYRTFRQQVKDLERQGALVRLRQNRYALAEQVGLMVGSLKLHPRGSGLVSNPQSKADVFVRQRNIGSAENGDLVQVEILVGAESNDMPEGRVVKVLEKPNRVLLGTFFLRGAIGVVRPDTGKDRQDIFLTRITAEPVNAGDKVIIRLEKENPREGEILEVLGDPGDPQLDYLQIYQSYDLPLAFPAEVEAEVETVEVGIDDALGQRRDLRHLKAFTIDPLSAKDFDDAISVQRTSTGGYTLGVHIADVSHYVQAGSAVDLEALKRSTSVYLIDRVIPMLPEKLASDICTLKPQEDRLAFSVLMEFDPHGRRTSYEIIPSVIHSQARLTYEQAQAVFDKKEAGPAEALRDELNVVKDLAEKLHGLRHQRGALDFDLAEPKVDLDDVGRVVGLGLSGRFASNRLIEACMLAANEAVGNFSFKHELPVLYRVHLPPDQEKIRHFKDYMAALGVRIKSNESVKPKVLQGILSDIAERPDAELIHKLLLRAMMRAEYSPEVLGHFGLACDEYLHFTSPIRRYPDLWVHRIIKAYLAEDLAQLKTHQQGGVELGQISSAAERQANAAERAYIRTKQLRYMEEHLGELYDGKVSGMVNSGFFVELKDLMVDGFCALATIDEYFRVDGDRMRMVGERSGKVIEMGTSVRVRIAAVDPLRQRMDLFFLSSKGTDTVAKSKKSAKPKKNKRLSHRR